jgi:hypothetical protein
MAKKAKKAKAKKAKAKKATNTKAAKTKKAKAKKTTRKATKKATRKAAPKARRAKAAPKGRLAVPRRLAPARAPRIQATPSDRDGFFIVCEFNPATGNFDLNCREVSADELRRLGAPAAELASRRGLAAGRRQISATPSDRDGFFIVCDFNPETRNFDLNCREVSAAELRALR